MMLPQLSLSSVLLSAFIAAVSALSLRIIYNCTLHPLAKFPGPWYAASTSLVSAIISLLRLERQWISALVKTYGTDSPIRISPTMLLFSKPSNLKDIYWDPKCNRKTGLYDTGLLGPVMLVNVLDGEDHRILRKALASKAPWSIGGLQREWESRIDDQIQHFVRIMNEKAEAGTEVCLSSRMTEFAADIMTMVSFTNPWGFVKNSRDERDLIASFRGIFDMLGFVARFRFFRKYIMPLPILSYLLLPNPESETGIGYLVGQADREISKREDEMQNGIIQDKPDFMQYCLDARIDGESLSPGHKRGHVTLLIQAGADTTGTALGSALRDLMMHPTKLEIARKEIKTADQAGKLSTPAKYEEVRAHLPYIVASIKESLRLNPPASSFFGRVSPDNGKYIDGYFIPPGTDMTAFQYTVQRDPELYAPDPDSFRPERWLTPKASEYEASSLVFGMGPRVCLGKDLAIMELYKVIAETLRVFDIKLVREGRVFLPGGLMYLEDFTVKLSTHRS